MLTILDDQICLDYPDSRQKVSKLRGQQIFAVLVDVGANEQVCIHSVCRCMEMFKRRVQRDYHDGRPLHQASKR